MLPLKRAVLNTPFASWDFGGPVSPTLLHEAAERSRETSWLPKIVATASLLLEIAALFLGVRDYWIADVFDAAAGGGTHPPFRFSRRWCR
jgi:hypothetical protein